MALSFSYIHRGDDGILLSAQLFIGKPEVVIELRILRAGFQSFLIVLRRLGIIFQFGLGITQIGINRRPGWGGTGQLLIFFYRSTVTPFLEVQICQSCQACQASRIGRTKLRTD